MVAMVSESTARVAALPAIIQIPIRAPERPVEHLPAQHTPLVGREQELASVCALLARDDVRLVTLIGPGGVGKTRLAVRAAEELAACFADGVAFVALASVRGPERTLPAMYQALGGRETGSDYTIQRLHHVLGDRELLLLLDNFEHLVSAAASISDVLAACPRLKILVTSRSPLQLSGEHDFLVPPLALPTLSAEATAGELIQADAVRLFVQRARTARPDFAPTAKELSAVSAICHRLNGLPLAIELAAARVNHLSPQSLLERLERPGASCLPLLTGGLRDQPERHQAMRDTVAWSFNLLDAQERAVFQRLSVFVDGFSVQAASAVCDLDELSTLDGIGSLVAKSLVRYDGDRAGEPRYAMYETIREFGLEQLALSGQEETVRQQQAEWALALAERAGPHVREPDAASWLEELERDHASLRAALTWFAERQDGARLARLAGTLWPFWEEHAHFAEGRNWLEAALAQSHDAPPRDRLQLLAGAGAMARHHTDFAHGIIRHEQALALARELGDREEEATILHHLGAQATDLGDFVQARLRMAACIAVAREAGTPRPLIRALHGLGQIQRAELDSEAALQSLEEVLPMAREHQMGWIEPYIVNGIALAATDLGDCGRAIALCRENITRAIAKGALGHVIDGIEGLARVAATLGQAEQSARLYGAGEAQREKLTFPISPTEITYAEPILRRLREVLGGDGFATAWAEGRLLSQEAAIAEAMSVQVESSGGRAGSGALCAGAYGLTERELEVLRLLATGHSNRELGDALFISPTTAARHVANIFNKLGVDSRAKASAYAHQHGLV